MVLTAVVSALQQDAAAAEQLQVHPRWRFVVVEVGYAAWMREFGEPGVWLCEAQDKTKEELMGVNNRWFEKKRGSECMDCESTGR